MVSRPRTHTKTRRGARDARAKRLAELRAADQRAALLRTADAYARRNDATAARGALGAIPIGTTIPAIEINTCKIDEEHPPCWIAMRCLCAAHARGAAAHVPCDATETPRPRGTHGRNT